MKSHKNHLYQLTLFFCRLDSGVALLFSGGEDVLDNQVQVEFNGHVRLLLPAVLSISCIMDMSMYPFDTQRCNLRFGE